MRLCLVKARRSYGCVNLSVMASLRKDVDLLRNLVTFEVASRSRSFTAAAEELGVSRVAVSRQIAELERSIDQPLFVRGHRSITLTNAGEAFASAINPALHQIADALSRQRTGGTSARLSVTVTSAFATYWLMPRLAAFGAAFPDVEINLVVSDRYLDLNAENVDIAIRYAPDNLVSAGWEHFITESIFPVYSPLYRSRTPLTKPEDLLSEQLLHLSGRYRAEARWGHWFRQQHIDPPEERKGVQVNTYINMLQAAIEGQGVALAGHPLIDTFVEQGTLKTISNIEPLRRLSYYLYHDAGNHSSVLFRDWLVSQYEAQPKLHNRQIIEVSSALQT